MPDPMGIDVIEWDKLGNESKNSPRAGAFMGTSDDNATRDRMIEAGLLGPGGAVLGGGLSGDVNGDGTIDDLDRQIAELEGQIATAMQAGGGSPDYSAFFKSPGYEFRMDEGVRARERGASAKGMLMSGGMQRELTRYGQGLASSEFGNYANRLASLAGIGQTANQQGIYAGANAAGQVGRTSTALGETVMAGGSARAGGIIGANNALQQGIGGAIGAVQQWGGGYQPSGALQSQAYYDVNYGPNARYF